MISRYIGEKGGTGADVIAKGWKDNGWSIPMVVEKSNPDRIETSLYLEETNGITTETTTKSSEISSGTQQESSETSSGTRQESSEVSSGTQRESSGTRQKTSDIILEMIKNDPKITAPQIATELALSTRAVEKNLRSLREVGLIRRIGSPTFGGYWEITTE